MVQQLQRDIRTLQDEVRRLKGRIDNKFSGNTLIVSPPIVSNSAIAVIGKFTNNTGGVLNVGDVVILDASGLDLCNVTGTADDITVLGVVQGDDGPYVANALTPILIHGNIQQVAVTGTVFAGEYLNASATPGVAYSVGATPTSGTFARAETGNVGGFCSALVFPVIVGAGGSQDDVFIINMAAAL